MLKRTPLYAAHQRLGGKLIEFGGWEMPVQYSSIMDEHHAVRKHAGLFDISHMGEVRFSGPAAEAFLNYILTNDIRKLALGQGQYTQLCNERGGTVDDLYAYRLRELEYLLIVNASRIEADGAWMEGCLAAFPQRGLVVLEDQSSQYGAIALQGPRAPEIIGAVASGPASAGTRVAQAIELKKNEIAVFSCQGEEIYVARTGYTGEDGFEIVAPNHLLEGLWERLLATGHPCCLQPAGLGARDTLRTEMGYPLYGHELDEETSPIEAGVGFFVALEKPEFVGRAPLVAQKQGGLTRKCVAFRMADKTPPPRPHYPIYGVGPDAVLIGQVSSGTQSPSLGCGIGLGYVPPAYAKPGTPIAIEIRGRRVPAVVVSKPLYRRSGAQPF